MGTLKDGLFTAMISFHNGDPDHTVNYKDGMKGIRINEKVVISLDAMQQMDRILRKYGDRPYPVAGVEKQSDCLSYLTFGAYLNYEILGQGEYPQPKDGVIPLFETENHLKKCDYCFSIMIGSYIMLIDITSVNT